MDYEVEADGQRLKVGISVLPGRRTVSIGSKEGECDWIRLPDGGYTIILDGRVFDLSVEAAEESCLVSGREGSCVMRVIDPRGIRTDQPSAERVAGLRRICAEIPGRVIRVLVRPGDTVESDQGLLVIEAMKMQNEIRAPGPGIVKEVAAREETTVSSGEFLLSIG